MAEVKVVTWKRHDPEKTSVQVSSSRRDPTTNARIQVSAHVWRYVAGDLATLRNRLENRVSGHALLVDAFGPDTVLLAQECVPYAASQMASCRFYPAPDLGPNWYRWSAEPPVVDVAPEPEPEPVAEVAPEPEPEPVVVPAPAQRVVRAYSTAKKRR